MCFHMCVLTWFIPSYMCICVCVCVCIYIIHMPPVCLCLHSGPLGTEQFSIHRQCTYLVGCINYIQSAFLRWIGDSRKPTKLKSLTTHHKWLESVVLWDGSWEIRTFWNVPVSKVCSFPTVSLLPDLFLLSTENSKEVPPLLHWASLQGLYIWASAFSGYVSVKWIQSKWKLLLNWNPLLFNHPRSWKIKSVCIKS